MARPVKFAHVVYQTRRYDEMIAWYQDVFEAKVVHQDAALAFLTYDDEHHRFAFANLELLAPGGGEARGQIGVNHVAYTFANAGDLLDTYDRLKARGIAPYWPVHHGTTMSLYYQDPDGNRMEFQVDVGTVAEATDYMGSAEFAANPVGVVYDPDRLLARYRAGADHDSLIEMPAGPPSGIPQEHGLA